MKVTYYVERDGNKFVITAGGKEYSYFFPNKKYTYLGDGYSRWTLARGNVVVKVPKSAEGLEASLRELAAYTKRDKIVKLKGASKVRLARCRMLGPFLVMTMVNIPENRFEAVRKAKWEISIDCTQVGYRKNGELVAYDYGSEGWMNKVIGVKEWPHMSRSFLWAA